MKYYLSVGIIFLIIVVSGLKAQQTPTNEDKVKIEDIAVFLNQESGIRLFYEDRWFEDQFYSSHILTLPVESILKQIILDKNLTYVIIENTIVFLPEEAESSGVVTNKQEVITVGNPNEYGKFSNPLVEGSVVDGQNGESLVGAILQVEAAGIATTTGIEGDFSFNLPVGRHTIKISFVGYEDALYTINLVSNGTVVFELFEKSLDLEEVVVTARRADSNVSQAQMSQVRLDAQTIQQLPTTFGEIDVIKSVTLMPGVSSMGEFGTGFNVRGGSADQNLILVEGMPLFNSSHLFGLISIVNPDLVSGVNLIKGGISSKYGERVSSVMDIKIGANNIEKFSLSGGVGLLNNRLSIKTPLFNKNSSLVLGGRFSYTSWLLKEMPDVDLMNSEAGFYDLSGLFNTRIGKRHNLSLFGYYSNDDFALSDIADHRYNTILGSIRWNFLINSSFTSTVTAGTSLYDYEISEDRFPVNAYKIKTGIEYRTVKWNLAYLVNNKWLSEFGLQAIEYKINPGNMLPVGDQSFVEYRNMEQKRAVESAAYINNEVEITENLAAEAGLRFSLYNLMGPARAYQFESGKPRLPENIIDTLFFERNQSVVQYNGLEPRLSLRYSFENNNSVKASYNRINQYVSLLSNTSVAAPADIWELSSYNIKPLVADQVGLGYFQNFMDNALEASVEVYYKKLKNVTEVKSGARIMMNDFIESDLINAEGYNYGIEVYARKSKGKITGWASYTYSVSRRRSQSSYIEEQINGNRYFPSNFDQPHNFVVNANVHLSKRWRFNANFTYNTGRPVTLPELRFNHGNAQLVYYSDRNKYRLNDYHRLDISITYEGGLKLKKTMDSNFSISIVNVYGRKNPFSVFYQKEMPSQANDYRRFSMYQLYIIGRPLPTFTYTFRF